MGLPGLHGFCDCSRERPNRRGSAPDPTLNSAGDLETKGHMDWLRRFQGALKGPEISKYWVGLVDLLFFSLRDCCVQLVVELDVGGSTIDSSCVL